MADESDELGSSKGEYSQQDILEDRELNQDLTDQSREQEHLDHSGQQAEDYSCEQIDNEVDEVPQNLAVQNSFNNGEDEDGDNVDGEQQVDGQNEINGLANATFHGSQYSVNVGRKPTFGQSCSLRTLLQDGILQAGEKVLSIDYMGTKFCGDLRRDGTIMMRGPDNAPHVYATPSAWANHCCKIINPENKPGSAWSSIRFRGKRLDSYKLKWYRAQKKPTLANDSGLSSSQYNNNTITINDNSNNVVSLNNNINNSSINSNLLLQQRRMQLTQQRAAVNNAYNATRGRPPVNNTGNKFSVLQQLRPTMNNNQQGRQKLHLHNPISNNGNHSLMMSQYEPPFRNKKLIESILLGNNMDRDCRDLVAKSLDNSEDPSGLRKNIISYEMLGTRGSKITHNPNIMIKCVPFTAIERIQPFNVTISTNALLLIDFHSHIVRGEVAGYLAGTWDLNTHNLTISQAFPCRTKINDEATAKSIEEDIRAEIERRKLTVVGWYHSHQGKYSNHPTLKDIQSQIEYQITMKESINGYSPCIGLICCPHDIRTKGDMSPTFQMYWVMPPPEHLPNHYGRPMQMVYSVTRDLFLTQDLLLEMRLLANHYGDASEMVDFKAKFIFDNDITNLDKLSGSIRPKLPKDLQESEYPDEPAIWKAAVEHFWKFLKNLVVDHAEAPEPSGSCNEAPENEESGAATNDEKPEYMDTTESDVITSQKAEHDEEPNGEVDGETNGETDDGLEREQNGEPVIEPELEPEAEADGGETIEAEVADDSLDEEPGEQIDEP